MAKKPKVSIFIPIFNEEKILEYHIRILRNFLNQLPQNFEIFVVDDASTDMSNEIMKEISKSRRNVKHLRYELGPTRRENLTQSFKKANGKIVVMMDMDLATNLKYLPRLIEEIDKNKYDICTGSRYIEGSKVKRSLYRRVVSKLFIFGMHAYFGSKLSDYECGFKAFKKPVIVKLVKEIGYDKSLKRGVFWDAEMLMRAEKKRLKIKEIPIEWTEGDKSELKFKREVKMLPYILKFKKTLKKL